MELIKKKVVAILVVLCVCIAVFGVYALSHPRQHIINILERNIDACIKAEACLSGSGNIVPNQAIQGVKEISSSSSSQVDLFVPMAALDPKPVIMVSIIHSIIRHEHFKASTYLSKKNKMALFGKRKVVIIGAM